VRAAGNLLRVSGAGAATRCAHDGAEAQPEILLPVWQLECRRRFCRLSILIVVCLSNHQQHFLLQFLLHDAQHNPCWIIPSP